MSSTHVDEEMGGRHSNQKEREKEPSEQPIARETIITEQNEEENKVQK